MGTLYPPILDTTQPAFVNTEECKIYFIINSLNKIEDYNTDLIQIKITDNRTGKNVLREDLYPNAIKFVSLQEENNQYFITFTANDLNFESFPINNYYKVQIRFTAEEVATNINAVKDLQWFVNNIQNFSAWSSACLVRAISKPTLKINSFNDKNIAEDIDQDHFSFVGLLSFAEENEQDSLASYRIKMYNQERDILLEDSKLLMPESKNTFNYNIRQTLTDNSTFIIKVFYTTKFGYEEEIEYILNTKFNIQIIDGLNASSLKAEAIPELGAIRLSIALQDKGLENPLRVINKIKIFRTELKDRYNNWNLIYEITDSFNLIDNFLYQWDDIITESSEGYKYKIQVLDENGSRYSLNNNATGEIQTKDPVLLILDDMFLVANGLSLRIRYNPSITNFKYTLSESITNTIGSQYPFVRRNGQMNYRSFSIGGLLSCNTESELFDTLGDNNIIDSEDSKVNLTTLIDQRYSNSLFMRDTADYKKSFEGLSNTDIEIIYEKIFRDKVMTFLYNDSVKLFKSATEGNILVKLTNISFTPNQQLGRRIYSFTAQATEIDSATYENYKKYNIFESEVDDINVLNILSAPYVTEAGEIKHNSAKVNYTEVEESNTGDSIYFTVERGV